MNITLKQNNENKALSRKEVVAEVVFEKATPNRKLIQKEIAKLVKADEKLTIIKQIKTYFGSSKALITANIYNDENVMNKLERKNLIEKHISKEEPKAEEPAESPSPEPQEEVKPEAE